MSVLTINDGHWNNRRIEDYVAKGCMGELSRLLSHSLMGRVQRHATWSTCCTSIDRMVVFHLHLHIPTSVGSGLNDKIPICYGHSKQIILDLMRIT